MGYGKEFSPYVFFVLCFCFVCFVCPFRYGLYRLKGTGGLGREECKYFSLKLLITLKTSGTSNGHIRMPPNRPSGLMRGLHGSMSWNLGCVRYTRLFEINYMIHSKLNFDG